MISETCRLQRQRLLVQQRAVQLCEFNKSGFVDAYVLTFDGDHRADTSIGAYGWSVWSVQNDVWQFIHGEGRTTRDPTTVNIEEFSGVREGLVWVGQNLPRKEVHVFGDSRLVIGALQPHDRGLPTSIGDDPATTSYYILLAYPQRV